jgi:adenine C2-methylase RlmN of 23S rRNA A2503 and tRNA A37
LRSEVMPLNRKWNLGELMKAAREFPLGARERLTFEYVLLAGVNDGPEQAREVVELVRGIRAKINLIALNPGRSCPTGRRSKSGCLRSSGFWWQREFRHSCGGRAGATFLRRADS